MRNICLSCLLLVIGLLLGGCYQQYPGDPVPDPNANPHRKLPAAGGATPDRSQQSPGR